MAEQQHPEHPIQHQHYQPPPKMTEQNYMNKGLHMPSRYRPKASRRELSTCITIFFLVGITILILWLIFRPYKPRFTVVGTAIYGLNATTPPFISISLQFTILIRNPNKRASVYFDRFSAFVSYRNQPITPRVMLPPLYLEKDSTVQLSPVMGGMPVPVSAEVSNGFVLDEAYGVVGLNLVLQGRLRWKIGDIRTAHDGVYVKCDLLMGLKKDFAGQVPLFGAPACHVDI